MSSNSALAKSRVDLQKLIEMSQAQILESLRALEARIRAQKINLAAPSVVEAGPGHDSVRAQDRRVAPSQACTGRRGPVRSFHRWPISARARRF